MKKNLFSTILALLTIGAMLVSVGCKNYDDDISDINKRIQSLESATAQISDLQNKVATIETAIGSLSASIASVGQSVDANTADIKTLESSVTALKTAVEKANSDIAALKAAVDAQVSKEEVQTMIDKANAELTQKVNAALVKIADMQLVIDALPETVKAEVNKAVASIKDALGAVAGQIQSIVYMPTGGEDWSTGVYPNQYVIEDLNLVSKSFIQITYAVAPAELATNIKKEDVILNLKLNSTYKTVTVSVTPDQVITANGEMTAILSFSDKELDELYSKTNYDEIYINAKLTQENIVDGVNYGTEICSNFIYIDKRYQDYTYLYYTLSDGKQEWNGSIENNVSWVDYKNSEKAIFGSYQPCFLVRSSSDEWGGTASIEEVAELFDADAADLTPVVKTQSDLGGAKAAKFTLKKEGLASTVAMNVKTDSDAKDLTGETVTDTLVLEVVKESTHFTPGFYYFDKDKTAQTASSLVASYTVTKEVAEETIDPVTIAWNYDAYNYEYTFNELGISNDVLDPTATYIIDVLNADGEDKGEAYINRVSSKLVKVVLKEMVFPEEAGVYTIKFDVGDKYTSKPLTMSINVNAVPADAQIDLGTVTVGGSTTTTEVTVPMIVPSFQGNEAYYLGNSGYKKESLYKSLADGHIYTEPSAGSFISSVESVVSLAVDGTVIAKAEIGNWVDTPKYTAKFDAEGAMTDSSYVKFKNPVGYGHTYTLGYENTTAWGQKMSYTVTIETSASDAKLEPTGYVKDGVVTVGGSVVEGSYTIDKMTFLKYLKLNAGSVDVKDCSLGLSYTTEAGGPFTSTSDNISASGKANTKIGCVGAISNAISGDFRFNDDGTLPYSSDKVSTWNRYTGTYFNVTARLKVGTQVTDSLTFKVQTAQPISNFEAGEALTKTVAVNVADSVYLYQNIKVFGCLAPEKNLVFFDTKVAGTAGFPWATTKTDGTLDSTTGNLIYGQVLKFDASKAKAYVGTGEVPFSDVAEIDNDTYQLKIKAQGATATYKIEIPVSLDYMISHSGKAAFDGKVTVNVEVK